MLPSGKAEIIYQWRSAQLNCPPWRPNFESILSSVNESEIGEITLQTRRILHVEYATSLVQHRKKWGAIVRHVFPQNPKRFQKN
jgi:hypothetical protein